MALANLQKTLGIRAKFIIMLAGLGVVALLLGIVGKLLSIQEMMGITPGGFVRGATALFLLTLVVMAYDRVYGCCETKPPETKP